MLGKFDGANHVYSSAGSETEPLIFGQVVCHLDSFLIRANHGPIYLCFVEIASGSIDADTFVDCGATLVFLRVQIYVVAMDFGGLQCLSFRSHVIEIPRARRINEIHQTLRVNLLQIGGDSANRATGS